MWLNQNTYEFIYHTTLIDKGPNKSAQQRVSVLTICNVYHLESLLGAARSGSGDGGQVSSRAPKCRESHPSSAGGCGRADSRVLEKGRAGGAGGAIEGGLRGQWTKSPQRCNVPGRRHVGAHAGGSTDAARPEEQPPRGGDATVV